MTKFSALLATAGLVAVSAPLALAQETLPPATAAAITQFLSDSAPAACTIQVISVPLEESEHNTTDILSTVPAIPCDAVSGTDDGDSKNFNFLNVSGNNFYKVITSSAPITETANETYQFSVEGVKVVPLDEAGNAANLSEVEYLYPADTQVCTADAIEQPRSVVCTFEVKEESNVLVGQLNYAW
ncbi:MAG: hypothetical protein AB8B99_21465 [Phormidesmis sp.]